MRLIVSRLCIFSILSTAFGYIPAMIFRLLISLFNRSIMFVVRSMRLWPAGARKTVNDCGTFFSSEVKSAVSILFYAKFQ